MCDRFSTKNVRASAADPAARIPASNIWKTCGDSQTFSRT
jgi:hypothetical protein